VTIKWVHEEAASTAVEDNINKSNAAMATQQQHQKGKGKRERVEVEG